MPKKFVGENTKAAEARARKAARSEEEAERKKQAEEDQYWRDDDKHVQKKLQRKEDKAKKQIDALERKQQNKILLEKEMEKIGLAPKGQLNTTQKVTRAEIFSHEEQRKAEKEKEEDRRKLEAKNISVVDDLLTENVNRLEIEGDQARTVDEALKLLGATDEKYDKNPEKRLKSTYLAFEEKHMPRLKAENPNLRLSQLKQMLKKEWQKSPDNPMNPSL